MKHEVTSHIYHLPFLLDLNAPVESQPTGKLFRFEIFWVQEERCKEIVQDSWKAYANSGIKDLKGILEGIQHALQNWNKRKFSNISKQVKQAQEDMYTL